MKLTKTYIYETLKEEKLWKKGEADNFTFNDWEITLKKADVIPALPFEVVGIHKNGSSIGRRYENMEKAFLHILNHFNENANIKNRYEKLSDVLFDDKSEISK